MNLVKAAKIEEIKKFTPEGQSPRVFYETLKAQIMGKDRQGNERPDEDVFYFLYVCKRTGLDPILKQIYPVYRWDSRLGKEKMSIQVGIDGMRLIAERTNLYGGSDDVVFEEKDNLPVKATVTVYKINSKTGERMPITASARYSEYMQTDSKDKPMGLWNKMPYLMLGKCAEALALRKAFPNELSGIYTEDEMPNKGLEIPKPEKKVEIEKTEPQENATHNIDLSKMRKENKNAD